MRKPGRSKWPKAVHKPALAATLLRQSRVLYERFVAAYQDILALSRQRRRKLLRTLGTSLAGAALALALSSTPVAWAADIVASGSCTLIDAITAANTDTATGGCAAGSGADTIFLTGGTITLTSVNNTGTGSIPGPNGLPIIISAITIEGNGATIARDAGAPSFRILRVEASGNLILNDTTISGGNGSTKGGGILNVFGQLTLNNSTVSGNMTSGGGGGIYSAGGQLTLNNSTISGNTASGGGGGIANPTSTTFLNNSTVSGNTAGSRGGGLDTSVGALFLTRSLITGNSAPVAAELFKYSFGFVFNNGFNLFGHSGESNAQAFSDFTPGGSDITATSDGTTPTALAAILGPLADNGGPTLTHALVTGSPAIDAAPSGPATDQRGYTRPAGAAFDIGAFELGAQAPPATQITQLGANVQALITSGALSGSNGGALLNKLDAAQTQLDKGNINAVITKLQDFITQVTNYIASGKLTAAQGQPLIDAANAVIQSLSVAASSAGAEAGNAAANQLFLPLVTK